MYVSLLFMVVFVALAGTVMSAKHQAECSSNHQTCKTDSDCCTRDGYRDSDLFCNPMYKQCRKRGNQKQQDFGKFGKAGTDKACKKEHETCTKKSECCDKALPCKKGFCGDNPFGDHPKSDAKSISTHDTVSINGGKAKIPRTTIV